CPPQERTAPDVNPKLHPLRMLRRITERCANLQMAAGQGALVVHPLSCCGIWHDGDPGAAGGAVPPSTAPDERMLVGVPVRGGAAGVRGGECLPRRRSEGTEDIALAASAIVDLLLGPLRFGRGRLDHAPAGVTAS